jgi:hypothetical protein
MTKHASVSTRFEPADRSDVADYPSGDGIYDESGIQIGTAAQIPEYDYCTAPEARKSSARTYKPAG